MSQNNILRDFAKYSSLSVLGMLAMSCYILADTFFVSPEFGDKPALPRSIWPFPPTTLSTASG